jgi:hypothetical protein
MKLGNNVDAITSLRQAATVKPTPMQPVKTTHAAGEATADDSQVRYVWELWPNVRTFGRVHLSSNSKEVPDECDAARSEQESDP